MIPVIICGGVGSKMWPESRTKSPKHFLPLVNGKSLFEINWEALRMKYEANEIYLQTNEVQAEIAKKLVPEIVAENVFVEPEMRNQGPATGFAAAQLIKRGKGNEVFMLIQADVLREPSEKLVQMMMAVDVFSKSNDKYLTAGVVPESIVRGVDYLVKGELLTEENGVKIFAVADYIDRSEEDRISQFMGSDKLVLHANHTAMTPNNLLKMYQKYKPEWYQPLVDIANGGDVVVEYAKMPKGPIEDVTKLVYKNNESIVVELPFKWIDFGTWESLANYLGYDENKNFVRTKKYTAIIGLNDLVVVETGDALLIMPKNQSGKVGEVVEKLKAEGRQELL